ncbi:MAG: hypothetical protein GY715_07885 [Planctomycetes bacterium]|nr:hypothetical protein [Planctomycetota bacterium]
MDARRRHGCLAAAALIVGTLVAQTAPPPTGDTPVTPPLGSAERPARASVLREGSRIVRVAGRAVRAPRGEWVFVIDPDDATSPGHEMTVLPCSHLSELEHMVASAPGFDLAFEMTGQVYVFRGRNYLLPTHPPLLVGHERRDEPSPAEAQPSRPRAGEATGDSAEDIIHDLERTAGPLPRRAAVPAPAAAPDDRLVPEGTVLLARRGTVRRSASGAFTFIFDADAEGLADPPMTLLPCLLLERLERYARKAGEDAKVLITGHVHTYQGRNFMRPSIYRIPRDRTMIAP